MTPDPWYELTLYLKKNNQNSMKGTDNLEIDVNTMQLLHLL